MTRIGAMQQQLIWLQFSTHKKKNLDHNTRQTAASLQADTLPKLKPQIAATLAQSYDSLLAQKHE